MTCSLKTDLRDLTLTQALELYTILHGASGENVISKRWLNLEERFIDKRKTNDFNSWRRQKAAIGCYGNYTVEWLRKQNELTD